MEVVEGSSPRRGSLMSLHRQSSGSFSKVNSPSSHQLGNNTLCKDLDKFTKHFIIKTIQVIVQSRIGGNKKVKTECRPNGNDWFNINISDIPEVSEQTKSVLDFEGFSVRSNWRVCCEISLKTSDGGRVPLEHWILSNRTKLNSSLTKLNGNSGSPSGNHHSSRLSPLHNSSGNNSVTPLNTLQTFSTSSTSTTRTRTYSQTPRTRLNSIEDCSGDNNSTTTGYNNENFDIKPSTSCFSLSSTTPNRSAEQTSNNLISSPSTASLSNNLIQGQSTSSNNGTSPHCSNNKTAVSSIYTIYNRMSLLLKTLMTTTHIVPAYGIASRTSNSDPDSYTICYRVYACSPSYQNQKFSSQLSRGSLEDVSSNFNSESPNSKRSPSNLSLGSLNIRDFVSPDELDQFCPILKLGSVKTEVNDLDVSLCYRTDVRNSAQFVSSRLKDRYNKLLDEDCIVAAKQLLACNEHLKHNNNHDDVYKNDNQCNNEALDYIDRPLKPAFAHYDKNPEDPNTELVESVFEGLLQFNNQHTNGHDEDEKQCTMACPVQTTKGNPVAQSEPIQVPKRINKPRNTDMYQNLSAGSTPKSLTDSFVFVDLNPPFASEEQNDINSFFHGPSPAFTNGFDALKDVDELTSQLAVIEANASQLDEFVDNICLSDDDEEEDCQ